MSRRRAARAAKPATGWNVVAIKSNGERRVVGCCPTEAAAQDWAKLLRGFSGGRAEVEPAERKA